MLSSMISASTLTAAPEASSLWLAARLDLIALDDAVDGLMLLLLSCRRGRSVFLLIEHPISTNPKLVVFLGLSPLLLSLLIALDLDLYK